MSTVMEANDALVIAKAISKVLEDNGVNAMDGFFIFLAEATTRSVQLSIPREVLLGMISDALESVEKEGN